MARYLGRGQVAICQRSGKKVKRIDLVEDGMVKGLLVAKEWYEVYHPLLLPPPMRQDGMPKWRPAPDDRLSPPAPTLTQVGYAAGVATLEWTAETNNICWTDYYQISAFNAATGVYTVLATINCSDTYVVTNDGLVATSAFPQPYSLTVAAGTVLVIQAHSQNQGISAYSNAITVSATPVAGITTFVFTAAQTGDPVSTETGFLDSTLDGDPYGVLVSGGGSGGIVLNGFVDSIVGAQPGQTQHEIVAYASGVAAAPPRSVFTRFAFTDALGVARQLNSATALYQVLTTNPLQAKWVWSVVVAGNSGASVFTPGTNYTVAVT